MATIKVLGTGCHNCLEQERRLADALAQLERSDIKVERMDDERIIRRQMPLDAIPGLLIDDKLVSQRQVSDMQTLLDWLSSIPVMEEG
jgi:hypothetical protein